MRKYFLIGIIITLVISGFQLSSMFQPSAEKLTIRARWIRGHQGETWKDRKSALLWSFSLAGASLPKGCIERAVTFDSDSVHFLLDFRELGFSEPSKEALSTILDRLKASDEYQSLHCIDLDRILVLSVYSSWSYYKITNAHRTYQDFLSAHKLKNGDRFVVTKSIVAYGDRIVRFVKTKDPKQIAFIAEMGKGSAEKGTFELEHYEVFDVMDNGQLRFAVYDKGGQLIDASSTSLGHAGKPSKCMWCHESSIQPLYVHTPPVKNALTEEQFTWLVSTYQNMLMDYRKTLSSELNYQNRQEHTKSEIAYISFMEPSAFRIAQEWGISENEASNRLRELSTHVYHEFLFLGDLYHRKEIDALSPFRALPSPASVREPNDDEPNFFRW